MRYSYAGFAAVMSLAVMGAGCTDAPEAEAVGQVVIQLTATGPDGSVYQLPRNTFLSLENSSFHGQFPLDERRSSITVKAPLGEYAVELTSFDGHTTEWPLSRRRPDGVVQTVSATLDLTPSITVVADEVTPLVLRFHVAGVVPVTFSAGSIQVSVSVDEVAGSSLTFRLATSSIGVTDVLPGDETMPAALLSRLPALGETDIEYAITLRTVGPWLFNGAGQVCAPVEASHEADGHPGFVDLVTESPPSQGDTICINQSEDRATLSTSGFRFGTATTALLSDLGADEYFIHHSIFMSFEEEIFDGQTLHLNRLAGARPMDAFMGASIAASINNSFHFWFDMFLNGDGISTLTAN